MMKISIPPTKLIYLDAVENHRKEKMTRALFIIWLSAGVLIGWLVSQMFEFDQRRSRKLVPIQISSSEKM